MRKTWIARCAAAGLAAAGFAVATAPAATADTGHPVVGGCRNGWTLVDTYDNPDSWASRDANGDGFVCNRRGAWKDNDRPLG